MAALTPEARLLEAAERGGRVAAVEANHSIFQPLQYAEASLQNAGKDIGNQTIFSVVCARDDIHLIDKGLNSGHRPKDFRAHAIGGAGNVEENSRRIEESFTIRQFSAETELRSFGKRLFNESGDLVALLRVSALTKGPTSMSSSNPLPTSSVAKRAVSHLVKSSAFASCT
jgi:hypothetical protein